MNFRKTSTQRVFVALIPTLLLAGSWVWAQMELDTEVKRGTVLYAKGNSVMVREPSGDDMLYTVPQDFRVRVDGRDVPVSQLKPGTELIATITTVTRPRTVQTTDVIRGKVWEVVGNNVMVTLENGERKQYAIPRGFRFNVEGEEKGASELRRGMKLRATIIQKKQQMVTESTTVVSGLPPAPSR
jgi:hypothetical protein